MIPSRPTIFEARVHPRRAPRRARRAFTLAELVAVMAITAVLAASAAPAVRALHGARSAALSRETARLLALARAHATATGQPTGLVYDADDGVLALRRIASDGAAPGALTGPLGEETGDVRLASSYPGAEITAFVTGDGVSTHTNVWFTPLGEPEVRDDSGASLGGFTQDAVITFTGAHAITVRRSSGAIER